MLSNREIILGSASPRRQELLKNAGFRFEIISPDVEEVWEEGTPLEKVPEYLAKLKAKHIVNNFDIGNKILVTADTIVLLNNEIIGKPTDRQEAIQILKKLSGQTHHVITGVAICYDGKSIEFSDKTEVTFNKLLEEEIIYYVDTYKPYDKAGAYAIQEWIGHIAISKINGCFYNVMGLPIQKVYKYLIQILST